MSIFKSINESYQKSVSITDLAESGFFRKSVFLLKKVFEYIFGVNDAPLIDMPFPRDDIERYYHLTSEENVGDVDHQTMKDLELVKYTDQFFPETSIFGQQMLHSRLRSGVDDVEASSAKSRYIHLVDDDVLLQHFVNIFTPLRQSVTEISTFVFIDKQTSIPDWVKYAWILPTISISSFFLTAIHWIAILGLIFSFCIIVYLQVITYDGMSKWETKRLSLYALMKAADALAIKLDGRNGLNDQFKDTDASRKEVIDLLRPSRLERYTPWVGDYADWFLLKNIIRYYKCLKVVEKNKKTIRDTFLKVANLEADVAVARHLKQWGRYCWVERHDKNKITMDEIVNPFLANAFPMSIKFGDKGIFLSGQNGVGKSTFLRTIAINMVIARAFGFCYARSASFLALPVYTSIQIEDSLSGAESLYMAELRRAKELLNSLDAPSKGIYIIDEIFRGTNHLESVAAAASFLNVLSRNATVVISSHNLVLAPLLQASLQALCIKRSEEDVKKLNIIVGVLADPNGISLMKTYDFGSEIEDQALYIHRWLGEYLAHPTNFPELS